MLYPKYHAYTGETYRSFDEMIEAHPEISVSHPDYVEGNSYHVTYPGRSEIV